LTQAVPRGGAPPALAPLKVVEHRSQKASECTIKLWKCSV